MLPLVLVLLNDAMAQLSEAVGDVQVATAPHVPAVAVNVWLEGIPEITGMMLSVTVTVNDSSAVLPDPSVAVYVTVVVPTGKDEPETAVGISEETLQLSEAVGAVHVTVAAHVPAATFVVMLEGIPEITGSVTSFTVTVKLALVVCEAASIAV